MGYTTSSVGCRHLVPIVAQTPTCRSAISQRIDVLTSCVQSYMLDLLSELETSGDPARANVAEGLPLTSGQQRLAFVVASVFVDDE